MVYIVLENIVQLTFTAIVWEEIIDTMIIMYLLLFQYYSYLCTCVCDISVLQFCCQLIVIHNLILGVQIITL